ncbi:MAG: ribonuclease HI family protein [Candidatus Doudnabacteria bacterium]|nr:ribonuclease HI family protein [Candidatus Doudnabacteria bacterium]
MTKIVVLNTDGGARGNPGPAGTGVVIKDESGAILYAVGEYIGEATNNVAEYKALIRALEQAHKLGATEVRVNMDSELIVKQMLGQYKIKEPTLQQLAGEVIKLRNNFEKVSFTHVRRELNKEADLLVNEAIDVA